MLADPNLLMKQEQTGVDESSTMAFTPYGYSSIQIEIRMVGDVFGRVPLATRWVLESKGYDENDLFN